MENPCPDVGGGGGGATAPVMVGGGGCCPQGIWDILLGGGGGAWLGCQDCVDGGGGGTGAVTKRNNMLIRPLVKSAYQKFDFLISQPKHMLWLLKRTVSMRRFF